MTKIANSATACTERADLIHKQRAIVDRAAKENRKTNTEEKAELRSLDEAIAELEDLINTLKALESKEDDLEESAASKREEKESDLDSDDQEESAKRSVHPKKGLWETREQREQRSVFDERRSRVKTGNYRTAFRNYINGQPAHYRDIITGTDGDGGYLALPTELSAQFVFQMNNLSFMRKIAYVEQVKEAKSLGVRQYDNIPVATWQATEDTQTSIDTNSTFSRRDLYPQLLALVDAISFRTLSASSDAEKYVMDRSYYAMSKAAETSFLVGSGSGQPLGIFTASSNGIPTSQDYVANVALAKGFLGDDVINTFYSIPQQYTMSDKFGVFVSRGAMGFIRTLKTSTGQYLLEPGLAGNRPDTLLGAQIFMSEYAPAFNPKSPVSDAYVLCFGDFNYYHIAEVSDTGSQDAPQMQVLNERFADQHERGYVFRYFVDGSPVLANAFARLQLAAS